MAQIKTNTMEWIKAALIRAIRTAAQTALGMITVGAAVSEIDWLQVLSVAAVAAIYSMLTSVAGLPEVSSNSDSQSVLYTDAVENSTTYSDENGNCWDAVENKKGE